MSSTSADRARSVSPSPLTRPADITRRIACAGRHESAHPLPPGRVLVRAHLLSIDLATRNWLLLERDKMCIPLTVGDVMVGAAVGRVVESRADGFAPGDLVTGKWGCEDRQHEFDAILHRLWDERALRQRSHVIDGLEKAPESVALNLQGRHQGKLMVRVSDGEA